MRSGCESSFLPPTAPCPSADRRGAHDAPGANVTRIVRLRFSETQNEDLAAAKRRLEETENEIRRLEKAVAEAEEAKRRLEADLEATRGSH
jgi:hypothetical protein